MSKNNESNYCIGCGRCCKQYPGILEPEDLKDGVTEESLTKLLITDYCLDYWEGDLTEKKGDIVINYNLLRQTAYFIRPRVKGNNRLIDASWGGECSLLTETGCSLKFDDRPVQCRDLEPDISQRHCHGDEKSNKKQLAIKWLWYNDLIEQVIKKLRNK